MTSRDRHTPPVILTMNDRVTGSVKLGITPRGGAAAGSFQISGMSSMLGKQEILTLLLPSGALLASFMHIHLPPLKVSFICHTAIAGRSNVSSSRGPGTRAKDFWRVAGTTVLFRLSRAAPPY